MAYCTLDSVKKAFPWVDDSEWGVGVVPDDPAVEARIAANDRRIDAKLAERFAVPFDSVPDSIMAISRDLTIADVRERIFSPNTEPDAQGRDLRKRANDDLDEIKRGEMPLDAEGAAQASTTAGDDRGPISSWDDDEPDPAFTRDWQP